MKREDQAARFQGKVIGSGKFPGMQYAAVSLPNEDISRTGHRLRHHGQRDKPGLRTNPGCRGPNLLELREPGRSPAIP